MKSDINTTVARMEQEILADIIAGKVPANIRSFSDLSECVDVNGYGGLLEQRDAMTLEFGGFNTNGEFPQGMLDFINNAHLRIHEWILCGGIPQDLAKAQAVKALDVRTNLLSTLVLIEQVLKSHPDFQRGSSKVHFAVHKARTAIACTV
jgi:hypothetical protein